jgi:hypothetical protein
MVKNNHSNNSNGHKKTMVCNATVHYHEFGKIITDGMCPSQYHKNFEFLS